MRQEKIIAKNSKEFVETLNKTSRFPRRSTIAYMRNWAKWTISIDGLEVRCDTESNFVEDLIAHGYLSITGNLYQLNGYLRGTLFNVEYNLFPIQKTA